MARIFAILAVVVALAAGASAEIITLRDGQVINAPVLQETAERVVVDMGYEIITIPRAQVRDVRRDEAPAPAGSLSEAKRTDDLYSTADLAPQSVKSLTERFGEGVVLVSSPGGLGSGFFISEEGHLLTNFHVVEGERRLAVTVFRKIGSEFKREKIEEVEIIATNPFLDLALLKATLPAGYKPVITYLAPEDSLRDGDAVFAIGNPLGFERSVSQGIVSRRNRAEEGLAYIQTTTQINPGNSGGPLFNAKGEVVGVTNMKIMGGEGLGFAIPIRYAIDFLRNREAFTYNTESSEAGYRYLQPAERRKHEAPEMLKRK